MDYQCHKRFEDIYLISNEIVPKQNDMNSKYNIKLYRKYKQLKKINKKLQEKIINQHCSGCKCHYQLNNHTDQSISIINSINKQNNNNNCSEEYAKTDEVEEEEQMETNGRIIQEDEGLVNLPLILQNIIKNKVKQNKTDNKYLFKVGLYPGLCKVLCDTSSDSFKCRSLRRVIRPFILKHIENIGDNYMKILFHIINELRDIHQLYMRQFYNNQQK